MKKGWWVKRVLVSSRKPGGIHSKAQHQSFKNLEEIFHDIILNKSCIANWILTLFVCVLCPKDDNKVINKVKQETETSLLNCMLITYNVCRDFKFQIYGGISSEMLQFLNTLKPIMTHINKCKQICKPNFPINLSHSTYVIFRLVILFSGGNFWEVPFMSLILLYKKMHHENSSDRLLNKIYASYFNE